MYYVYIHKRCDSGMPFYVGKGKNDRAYSKKNRNKHWHHIVESCGYNVEVLINGVDEEFAFFCEQEVIDKYRRLGYTLANYTNGGEGPAGYKHTEESKQKMRGTRKGGFTRTFTEEHKQKLSQLKLGKPAPQKGKVLSEDHKQKLSRSHLGKLSDTFWWNNGSVNKRSTTRPGDGWVKGVHKNGK